MRTVRDVVDGRELVRREVGHEAEEAFATVRTSGASVKIVLERVAMPVPLGERRAIVRSVTEVLQCTSVGHTMSYVVCPHAFDGVCGTGAGIVRVVPGSISLEARGPLIIYLARARRYRTRGVEPGEG